MTLSLAIEITSNVIQLIMFIGFLYLFFDKPKRAAERIIPLATTLLITVTAAVFFTVHKMTFHYLYYLVTVLILVMYTVLFLKGRLFLRIMIPIAVSNILIAYLTVSVMSAFGKLPFAEAFAASDSFRCLVLLTANAIYGAFLFILYRFGKGKINIRSHADILAFIVIPVITCAVGITSLLALEAVDFRTDMQLYITVIALGTAAIVIVFWYLLIKTGQDARVKTDLMLSRQREELYKTSVLSTHEQIEKISAVKHDMKNHLMSVSMLIAQGEYNKAKAICDSASEQLTAAYTPVHTENPTLNAIMNVEQEKAQAQEIDFTYEITDALSFMCDGDVISVIANLCDNAIEYLAHLPREQRQMALTVSPYKSYCRIVCKNTVTEPILTTNPTLTTTKKDAALHGKGMGILKAIAAKYHGELLVTESEGQLTVSVVVAE